MLCDMGFETCQADPDVWLKPNVRPTNGFEYYEFWSMLMIYSALVMIQRP